MSSEVIATNGNCDTLSTPRCLHPAIHNWQNWVGIVEADHAQGEFHSTGTPADSV